jgi:ribose 5-phosphate isomerase B
MKVGIATDHGGFELKEDLKSYLRGVGHVVVDFGARELKPGDDYPDFVIPLAQAVAAGVVDRGLAVCGSGVGASVCANKIPGVRAALVQDHYSAHQGVEHDDMNILCMGGRLVGPLAARDLVDAFLAAGFTGEERHMRRLAKVGALEATQSAAKEIPLPTGPVGRSREGTSGQAIGS